MITVFIIFSILFIIWYCLPYLLRKIHERQLRKKCKKYRIIAITYDDGPSVVLSQQLINLLYIYNARATFFFLGHKLGSEREIADNIVRAGHEIGSHSYKHLNAWRKSPVAVYRDIEQGFAMTKLVGECNLFRAPHGKCTLATMSQVLMKNCRHAWWTIDSNDTQQTPLPIDSVIDMIRRDGGGVILMHDHNRAKTPEREKYVLQLTERILQVAGSDGYTVLPMGQIYSDSV